MNNKIKIAGIDVDNISFQECLDAIDRMVTLRQCQFIVTPNTDHVVRWQHDLFFQEIYSHAALVLADGMPIIWASNFFGKPLKEKISGSDLFPQVCSLSADRSYRVFLLGGRKGASQKATRILQARYPKLKIAGTCCPQFGFEHDSIENQKIVNLVKEANPDILFVGLGSPKQERWIFNNLKELSVPVSIGIGVSFEFVSGMVVRAPLWMQKSGLEWFWRLMMEPKRLWKRYLIDDIQFFWLIFKQKLGLLRQHKEDL